MKLRSLRLRWAVLFGLVATLLAVIPLLRWDSVRDSSIRDEFDDSLVEQMEIVHRQREAGSEFDLWFPAWQVNSNDEWVNPLTDDNIEAPLLTWTREAGLNPSFRNFSQDEEPFRAYISPYRNGEAYVTLQWAASLDDALDDQRQRTILWAAAIALLCLALGWLGAGLALAPARRMMEGQQGFLADAAHEMRTPLAVIMASSSQALGRERSTEEYVRSLSEIRSAAERASTGVNELLDLVRFDSGQAIPRLAPLRLDLLAEEVAASVRADEADVLAEPGPAVIVNADMALLRQALDNVVRNAVRRADRVELSSRLEDRLGVVEVADNGDGFDEAKLATVFDRYQRGDRQGGTGIGLAIVKSIVEANGGTVSAANGSNGGAVITMKFPIAFT